jgi:hypothetical protein
MQDPRDSVRDFVDRDGGARDRQSSFPRSDRVTLMIGPRGAPEPDPFGWSGLPRAGSRRRCRRQSFEARFSARPQAGNSPKGSFLRGRAVRPAPDRETSGHATVRSIAARDRPHDLVSHRRWNHLVDLVKIQDRQAGDQPLDPHPSPGHSAHAEDIVSGVARQAPRPRRCLLRRALVRHVRKLRTGRRVRCHSDPTGSSGCRATRSGRRLRSTPLPVV